VTPARQPAPNFSLSLGAGYTQQSAHRQRYQFVSQHPLSDTPAISLRLAEPPSVEGTGGGQMGDGALGAVAVAFAAWVDVSGISPGNNKGD
jgi:hypothetical protein